MKRIFFAAQASALALVVLGGLFCSHRAVAQVPYIVPPVTSGHCAQFASSASQAALGDAGAPCGVPPGTSLFYTCTGSGDDAMIQADVNTLATNGGTLYLSVGSCGLNNPVTLASKVSIVGTPRNAILGEADVGQDWTPSGGTIITAGTATQGFIYNATNQVAGYWPGTPLTGANLSHLTFSGFLHGGIVVGAQYAAGVQFSNWTDLAFYKCGSVGSSYTGGYPAVWLRNFMEMQISYLFETASYGFWFMASNVTQETGNSSISYIVGDTYGISGNGPNGASASATNFIRQLVFGCEPAIANTLCLEGGLQVNFVSIQGNNQNNQADTASVSAAGGTAVSITTNVANFPVGMPVQFRSTGPYIGPFFEYRTYFVLSNSGGSGAGTITLGLCRGCAAVSATSTASGPITQSGYPLVDLEGVFGTTGGLSSSALQWVGVGSSAAPQIYAENSINDTWGIIGVSNIIDGITFRHSDGVIISSSGVSNEDLDTSSSGFTTNLGNVNNRNAYAGSVGPGAVVDQLNQTQGLNAMISNAIPRGQTNYAPDLFSAASNGFIGATKDIGTPVYSATATSGCALTTGTLVGGYYALEQTSATTCALPALANSSVYGTLVGVTYDVLNTGSATNVVAPSSFAAGQYLNDRSAYTTGISLTTGEWARITGAYSAANSRTYWAVETNGTIN